MRIVLDSELCVGHGRCYTLAPDLFDADERGHCVVRVTEVPPELAGDARTGVANCPERALQIEE
jgi:ferredoxin